MKPCTRIISLKNLHARSQMLARVRQFFAERNILEVDTPLLSPTAPVATHIDVMTVHYANGQRGYLHTSPEYAMKRLLSEHPLDMYQLSHVFREGEESDRHNPEFTMIEWYRLHFSLERLMQETLQLIKLFIGSHPPCIFSYQELFLHYCGFDPFEVKPADLHPTWSLDTSLDYHMSFKIQPQMKGLTIVHSFPASQAALARLQQQGVHLVAARFEIYYNGLELANGFHELTDPIEQRKRFEQDIRDRSAMDKPSLPIDELFLEALEKGLPPCAGVAVGFDRLLMLHLSASSIKEVLLFPADTISKSISGR